MKTPGVYIVEKNAFPNAVVEVATAVPAFIGHTEKADNQGTSLADKPWRISSMAEFHLYFGGAPKAEFDLSNKEDEKAQADGKDNSALDAPFDVNLGGDNYTVTQKKESRFLLYYNMLFFFQNGGGPCFIVSVGDYTSSPEKTTLEAGLEPLIKEQEPTMVLVPDGVLIGKDDYAFLMQQVVQHCGDAMKSRIAILDVWDGHLDRQAPEGDPIKEFRKGIGINHLDYAAAYYPWVHTTIVQDSVLSYKMFSNESKETLKGLIRDQAGLPEDAPKEEDDDKPADKNKKAKVIEQLGVLDKLTAEASDDEDAVVLKQTDQMLRAMSSHYQLLLTKLRDHLNLLPPAAAMAGVYTAVDNDRGVWKAPANVSLNSVVAPAVNISHADQEDLNVPTSGKAINAIRSFVNEGVLVWGARTLDGNSLDWRYINVRRTMIMIEESIKIASKAYVFEPNTANTWVTMRSMIENFLTGIWKRGGLAGAVKEDAFSVHVGLGETMTSQDILDGILKITVLLAVSRPAEFIEITFEQQMQKS